VVVLGDGEEIEPGSAGLLVSLEWLAKPVTIGRVRVEIAKPDISGLGKERLREQYAGDYCT
jgi:hypothetical protein